MCKKVVRQGDDGHVWVCPPDKPTKPVQPENPGHKPGRTAAMATATATATAMAAAVVAVVPQAAGEAELRREVPGREEAAEGHRQDRPHQEGRQGLRHQQHWT
jgi:hypothetical protein